LFLAESDFMIGFRAALVAMAVAAASPASAAVTGFLANPGSNSADWTSHVTGTLGLGINTQADFTTAPLGALAPGFYQPSLGLTITTVAGNSSFAQIVDYSSTPSGTFLCPCSNGEGALPFSRMLLVGDDVDTILSFDTPVNAVGFFYGDKFNPNGTDPTTLVAYDGPSGTGTVLGSFVLGANSYQLGFQVFMGVASTSANIRSLVVSDVFSGTGDGTYIDNIRFSQVATPEPASLGLLAVGLLGLAARRRR
jgi:hypothetical protein